MKMAKASFFHHFLPTPVGQVPTLTPATHLDEPTTLKQRLG